MTRITRDEAHDLYMQIFGAFALGYTDVPDVKRTKAVVAAINARLSDHASEQTIVNDAVNGGERFWQCFQTYDSWTEEQAEDEFNRAWPAEAEMDAIEPKAKASSTTVANVSCHCGCGQPTNKGKGYLPGHDARHAGQVARAILALDPKVAKRETIRLIDTLPTLALQNKALAQVTRGNAKPVKASIADRHAAVTAPDGVVNGYVTRNRVRVPAQTFLVSGEQRMNINDAADGSGDWLDAEGYDGKTQAYWLKRFHVTVERVTVSKGSPKRRAPRKPGGDGPEALKSLLTF